MTITATTNLSLPIITTGTEAGVWGDVVDNGLTSYLDIAIAGGLAITITTADVTLTNTAGTSSATNIGSTTAQYAILNISGAKTAARNLNLPISSKWYIINNSAATGGFLLTVRGVTPTGGITLIDGEKAIVAWNGTDYVKIANIGGSAVPGSFTTLTASTSIVGRYNPRVVSTASTATLSPDISAYDQYDLTAQAVALTIAAPVGTPVDGNKIIFRILDNGTAQTLSWNATYTPIGVFLPTITTQSKMLYVGCIYNATNTRWDVVLVTTQV